MSPPPKRTRSRNGEKVHRSRKKPVINSSERASSGEHDLSNEKLRARIDELSKTRDELEYNRNRYLNFFQYAPFAYAILDHDGLIRDFNLQAHTMLGPIQRGSLTGVPLAFCGSSTATS